MKQKKFKCAGFFEPKETWFLLPLFMFDIDEFNINIALGWLCFGIGLEISREK